MEKNNSHLQFETGATHAAVNELILYTDTTPELAAIRDSIYTVMQVIPTASLRPLLIRAIDLYSNEFGRNADTQHIRLMDQNERDEYCQIYANRFEEWKKEKKYYEKEKK